MTSIPESKKQNILNSFLLEETRISNNPKVDLSKSAVNTDFVEI
jgi:hypothetical protein